MFGIFKKNKKTATPQLIDIDNNVIVAGDIVESLRYDLGKCELVLEETQFYYKPLSGKESISWLKMIDASTDRQKVRKVLES